MEVVVTNYPEDSNDFDFSKKINVLGVSDSLWWYPKESDHFFECPMNQLTR